jgi:autotransporter-associated beta strand protein
LIIQDTGLTGSSVTAGMSSSDGVSGTTAGYGVFLHNVDLSIDATEGTAVTIADVISYHSSVAGAASSVTKTGGGTLTLEAANTYAGDTNFSAGILQLNGSSAGGASVNVGATLTGVGTIVGDATSNGTLAAGNGIRTLSFGSGRTVNGGTVDVQLEDAGTMARVNGDLYDVTGATMINGGTVNLIAADGIYSDRLEYTFLTAVGGLTGEFAGVTDNLVFFDTLLS